MTERPIIFNDAMSLAVIEGRKTVTRRPITCANGDANEPHAFSRMTPGGALFTLREGRYTVECKHSFGVPGDKLWVREAWRTEHFDTSVEYRAGLGAKWFDAMMKTSDYDDAVRWSKKLAGGLWAPSIHMPRWASRTALDVLDVRVERLQSMTEEDARAEGFESLAAFIVTWESIYIATMPWASNPWVWVVEFRRAT